MGYIQWGWVLLLIVAAQAQGEATRLVYFAQHEDEQEEDFIEIVLEIEAQSSSLVDAISAAGKVVQEVSSLSSSYCKEYTKKGRGDCKEAVQIDKFEIEPQYQMVRKQATFSTFAVTHQATINVFNPENIGYLVDSLLKYPQLTLKEFNWLPLNEVDPEQAAVKEGLEQGEDLCQQVGLALTKVIDVEEIEEPEPEAEQGEEEEEEPAEVTVYRFQVECGKPKKK